MARRRHHREALDQLEGRGVVDIHLVARQAVHHEELAVRAEAELIRVRHRHALLHLAGVRVEEQHLVPDGVADQQAACRPGSASGDAARAGRGCAATSLCVAMSMTLTEAPRGVDDEGDAGRIRAAAQQVGRGKSAGGTKGKDARMIGYTPAGRHVPYALRAESGKANPGHRLPGEHGGGKGEQHAGGGGDQHVVGDGVAARPRNASRMIIRSDRP